MHLRNVTLAISCQFKDWAFYTLYSPAIFAILRYTIRDVTSIYFFAELHQGRNHLCKFRAYGTP